MTGFGPTATLLDYNKTPLTPWLTAELVEAEMAIAEYQEGVATVFLDSVAEADKAVMDTLMLDHPPRWL